MQAELREQIRQAIDARARARRQAYDRKTCSGCGCDHDLKTIGCNRCSDRHRKWAKRTDPAFLENEREQQRAYRDRRRQGAKA